MYYFAIITSIMMPLDDPGETNRSCLMAGHHNMRSVVVAFPEPTIHALQPVIV
jgi:hypothetical protein